MLLIGAVAAVIAATGTLAGVAAAAAFTILVYYAIANTAALRLPADAKLYGDHVPITGLAGCTLLAFALAPATIATGIAVLAAGFSFRRLARRAAR